MRKKKAELRALVTGASSGIGAAFARALGARNEPLILVARRKDRLEQLAGQIGGEPAPVVIALDLADPKGPARLEKEIERRGLAVDLLVNNAGVGHTGRFHEQPSDRLLGMLDLNARALVDLTRRLLPPMLARGRGRIVNVASMASFQPVPFLAVYAASKAFVLAFSEALATELKESGVQVQALCPGNIPTEFQQVAETEQALFTRTPATSAEDVVAASLAGLAKNRVIVIPGLQNRLTASAQGLLPRSLVRSVAGELFKPR
jgi:short-subunit dehydrogenase